MANPLDYLKNLIPDDTNFFGASPDANLKKMLDMGLLGNQSYQEMIDKADKQSIFQGLLNTGLAYAAQPKTGNYGTIFPYLAKAGLAGMKAAQTPYDNLTKDAMEFYQLEKMQEEKDKKSNIQNLLSTYGKPNAFKESSKTYNEELPTTDYGQTTDSSLMGVNKLGVPTIAPNLQSGNATTKEGGAYFDENKFLQEAVASEALGLGDFLTLKASTGKTKDYKYLTKEEAKLRGLPKIPDTKAYQYESTTGETKVVDLGYRQVGTSDFETVSKELGYPVRLEMQTPSQTKEVNELITKRENDAAALSGGLNPNEFNTAATNKLEKELINVGKNRLTYRQLDNMFESEFLTYGGKLKAEGIKYKEKLGMELDVKEADYLTRYTQFNVKAAQQLNSYIKEITGAQMGEKEAERIRKGVPDADTMSATQYKAALDITRKDLAYAEARIMYLKKNGAVSFGETKDGDFYAKDKDGNNVDVPSLGRSGGFEGLIQKRGQEMAREMLRQLPNNKDGTRPKLQDYPTIAKQFKINLANEFGLPYKGL